MNQLTDKVVFNYNRQLENGIINVDRFINRNYLADLNQCEVVPLADAHKKHNNIRLYEISKVIFDEKENSNDKLISVYSAIQSIGATAIVVIAGDVNGVKYYLGVNDETTISVSESTLKKSFTANFPGSELKKETNSQIEEILLSATCSGLPCNISSVTVVPSVRDENKDNFVQGIEKFIDTMKGEKYTALFISSPVSQQEMANRKRGLEQLYTSLSPFVKSTLAYGENDSFSVAEGVSENFSKAVNESVAITLGRNNSVNESSTKGTSIGINLGMTWGSNKSTTTGTSSGTSYSKSETTGTSDTTSSGTSKTDTTTTGTSKTLTVESTNKTVEVILKNIDTQLERIKSCESFGIWESAAYFIAEEIQVSVVAANTYKALVSGEESNVENTYINTWNQHNRNTKNLVDYMKYCRHPLIAVSDANSSFAQFVTPANYISGKEIPWFMGIPQKSVSGMSVTKMAEFSRNVFVKDAISYKSPEKKLHLGCVHHMGVNENGNFVNLDMNSFTAHCFVTGSTGSGKSNTVYQLIDNFISNKIPFLVIEPAKGEYKKDFGGVDGINIFTSNPYMGAMLKINPFEFNKNIHILEHLDRLIEIFNACWEMYAAMPAILKSAVERAYIDKGWDLINSVYTKGDIPEFPTFADVLRILPTIISSSGYSSDTQGDYTGALVTRVASLTNGITGQIFCDNYFIDDSVLFDENTIVDLSRIGSTETKSLIMGILVMKITEYRMANATGTNKELSHVTILEEAHNLLKNVSQSQGQQSANPVGKSVEMICNSIAEMRTYGEGFIIVDQSPTSVDIAAIKNTNTKIVMRIPEKNDCESIGNAIGLNENQIAELSKLPVGVAAVMQNNWLEAVLCKVNKATDKFFKETEVCTFNQLKAVRSVLTYNMLLQFSNKNFEINKFEEDIYALNIPLYVKKQAIEKVRCLVNRYYRKPTIECFCNILVDLSSTQNIFSMNEQTLSKDELDNSKVAEWKNGIIHGLKNMLNFQADAHYEFLFKRLLFSYAKTNNNSAIDYAKIYNMMYEG